MNKRLLVVTGFAMLIFCPGSVLAQKCADDKTVIINVADRGLAFPYNLITSDGMGSYSTTKVKGSTTDASFQVCNGSHDLVLNLNASTRALKVLLPGGTANSQFFNFDRIASVPVTENSERFASFCGGRDLSGNIMLNTVNTSTADNYAGCGMDAGGYYVRRNVGFQLTSGRSLRFQNSPYDGGTLAAGTSYIKVYHPTVNTWTLSVEDIPAAVNPKCGINGSCGVVIYKPNNGPDVVDGYTLARFVFSVSSSKIYP